MLSIMNKIDPEELKIKVEKDLNLQAVSASVLLSKFRMIDENSRNSSQYCCPFYFPFYYHLGKYIEPKTMLEIGFTLGLSSCSFLLSCKTVNKFCAVNQEINRIGKTNVKQVYRKESIYLNEISDIFLPNSLDLTIINNETTYDKHLEYLDLIWNQVSENGLIIAEYLDRHFPAKEAFLAFCESKNRKPVLFKTRYGSALLQK